MKIKSIIFCCLFVDALMWSATVSALPKTKGDEPNRVSIQNHLDRGFRTSSRITLLAGGGFSIVNSDNGLGGERNLISVLNRKGYGANIGVGAIYQLTPYVGIAGNLDYISLNGNIENSAKKANNYSFHTKGYSATGAVIVNLASKAALGGLYGKTFQKGTKLIPYIKAGIGAISFTASSYLNNTKENERADYPKVALIVPISGGLRFKFSQELSIAPEFTFNFTSTDYLDNKLVSAGIIGANDKYITTSVKLMYTPRIKSSKDMKM